MRHSLVGRLSDLTVSLWSVAFVRKHPERPLFTDAGLKVPGFPGLGEALWDQQTPMVPSYFPRALTRWCSDHTALGCVCQLPHFGRELDTRARRKLPFLCW